MNTAKIFFLLLSVLLLSGCISNADPDPTVASLTAMDTVTRTPSPSPTSTPTITLTPTPTATSTITSTPKPDIEVMIRNLVTELGLDSEREYTFVFSEGRQYLVDTFNQAKMAKLEGGDWVDTTTEEKYGHLVPEGEITPIRKSTGNIFRDGDYRFQDGHDFRFENVQFCPRSTGNFWSQKEIIEGISNEGNEFDVVYGEFVFRNMDGKLINIPVRTEIIDPNDIESTAIELTFEYQEFCSVSGSWFGDAKTPDEVASYFLPGKLVIMDLTYVRPDLMPIPSSRYYEPGWRLSNIRHRANYVLWKENKLEFTNLANQLLSGSGEPKLIDGFLPANFVRPIFNFLSDFDKLDDIYEKAWGE
jgi:hypothetical protein